MSRGLPSKHESLIKKLFYTTGVCVTGWLGGRGRDCQPKIFRLEYIVLLNLYCSSSNSYLFTYYSEIIPEYIFPAVILEIILYVISLEL